MTRRELLDTAAAKTCGNREDTFPRIAKLWSANGDNVTPLDVCIKMMLLKIGRVQAGQSVEDSLVDIAGYAACAAEYLDGENQPEPFDPLVSAQQAYDVRNGIQN